MPMRPATVKLCTALLACGVLVPSICSAQASPKSPAAVQSGSVPAEQKFKNIQVLKGIPSEQLVPAMQFITASLGVECAFCHVENHFDQDDKKPKQIARKMMQMMMSINQNNFEGQREVTCNTCHRGARIPVGIPSISEEAFAVRPPVAEDAISSFRCIERAIGANDRGTQFSSGRGTRCRRFPPRTN